MISGIILAAGRSVRMGRAKLLLELQGKSIVRHVVENALGARLDEVLVVIGNEAARIREEIEQYPVRIVENPLFAGGQSTSLQAGMRRIQPDAEAVIILMADQPFVGPETIDAIVDRYQAERSLIVAPEYAGQIGAPVLFDRRLFPELLAASGDKGGRDIVRSHPDDVRVVRFDHSLAARDIDTWQEYEEIRRNLALARRRKMFSNITIVIKGAGDLATGVGIRLFRSGFPILMTEIAEPTPVRRTVSFAEAVFEGEAAVEGIVAKKVASIDEAMAVTSEGRVPVLIDPQAKIVKQTKPTVVIDAIMAKRNVGTRMADAPVVIALGPGFTAGVDAHAVVETNRGHYLGRVILQGEAEPNTGVPGLVGGYGVERVLRAPAVGRLRPVRQIGDYVEHGEIIGWVGDEPVKTPFKGIIRGLIHPEVQVHRNMKIGDVDPRAVREHCFTVSDKALSIGGGVLEAMLMLLHKLNRAQDLGKG